MLSVMVVDDHPPILDVTRGCTIMFARDLRLAGQLRPGKLSDVLQKSSFDAIVLDYDLPEI